MSADVAPTPAPPPAGLRRAVPAWSALVRFQTLNAISFQIALGPPLVLLADHWGASPAYIGLITCLLPLLATLQVVVAPRIEYIGFRKVMLSGWTARNVTLALAALLPWLGGWVDPRVLLDVLFALMFLYNLLRGLVSATWMPWIAQLVPEPYRGRYVSVEQLIINLSAAATFLLCGWVLGDRPGDAHFGVLYLISVAAGMASLYYLKNMHSPPPRPGKPPAEPTLVWMRRLWRNRNLRRNIRVSMMMALAVAAWNAFTIVFMRERLSLPQGLILYMNAAYMMGIVAASWVWGQLADRFGSRPVMALATRVVLVALLCWLLMALQLLPGSAVLCWALVVLHGVGFVGFTVGNVRYSLNHAPRADPVLGLTLFSFVTNLATALAPAVWGVLLELLQPLHASIGPLTLDRFGVFYAASVALLLATKALIRRLPDERSTATHLVLYHAMTDVPLRTLAGLYRALLLRERAR